MRSCHSYPSWFLLCRSRMLSSLTCILFSWTLLNQAIGSTSGLISSEPSMREICMLQTKSVRGQPLHLPPSEKEERRGKRVSSKSAGNATDTEEAPEQSAANHSQHMRKFFLFAQHKAGTLMGMEAMEAMKKALGNSTNVRLVWDQYMGAATDESEMKSEEEGCLLHLGRNPFEMTVSGYLYHKAETEDWLLTTFRDALAGDDGCPPPSSWFCLVNRGIANVFRESRSGPLSDWLPDAEPEETLPGYMKRVDLDTGLVAQFILDRDYSLASLRFTYDYVASHSCSVNVCYNEFHDQCQGAWQRVLKLWQIPEPQYSQMLDAVLGSCPKRSHQVWVHSSSNRSDFVNLEHPPLYDMLMRLRELDRQMLNGTLADLEEHVHECHLSSRYAAPEDENDDDT
mmetsp:Transcript_14616/g.25889  ORF Transcript_14616/g.25889 Transcript_14616/m.25889 type:complete len:398 (+) Transcript_14616:30-1223(+)